MKGNKLNVNDPMPEFNNLPGVDGKNYSSSDFIKNKILIIVFSCNHCPYVKAYEDRMISLQKDYSGKGAQLIAINSNDERNYPDDKFDEMVKRANQKRFNFKYLRDVNQKVAEDFGATHTPQFFVFSPEGGKWKLRYSGKMDDNWENPKAVKENYLRDALESILDGQIVSIPETFSIGCTIKWKTS